MSSKIGKSCWGQLIHSRLTDQSLNSGMQNQQPRHICFVSVSVCYQRLIFQNEQRALQFESVVMDAASRFFGGRALRIGAPWKSDEIPDYASLLDRVIDLIPNLGEKLRVAAPDGGDAGWDVLIVKNFCDNLIPRFIALGNCATGRTDWKRKGMETQPTLFWSYFQSDHRSVFITFFAVPFTMDEDARLRKLSSTALTLDRFRICEHAPKIPIPEIAVWIEGQRQHALEVPLN